eukprot:1210300-Prymnesium_polylepis.1
MQAASEQRRRVDSGYLETRQKQLSNEAFQVEVRLRKLEQEQPVMVKLGVALRKKRVRAVDLLKAWDTGGSGTITRVEFRAHVREMIDAEEGSDEEVNALFESLLSHGSPAAGELDLNALKPAVKHMLEAAAAAEVERAAVADSAAEHRRRSVQAKTALTVVQASIDQETRLASLVSKQPLFVRLGVAISDWAPEE